jgi:hypothetical protein
MTLAALIRKRQTEKVATAIPAIPATQPGEKAGTVAGIATVAVANPTEPETAPMSSRERNAIRAWLDFINEHDPLTISEMLEKAENVLDARRYFLERSKEASRG